MLVRLGLPLLFPIAPSHQKGQVRGDGAEHKEAARGFSLEVSDKNPQLCGAMVWGPLRAWLLKTMEKEPGLPSQLGKGHFLAAPAPLSTRLPQHVGTQSTQRKHARGFPFAVLLPVTYPNGTEQRVIQQQENRTKNNLLVLMGLVLSLPRTFQPGSRDHLGGRRGGVDEAKLFSVFKWQGSARCRWPEHPLRSRHGAPACIQPAAK